MSNLTNRNQSTVNQLSEIQVSIENLKLQLEALNKQFTEATKVANAQANLTKQWKEAIAPLKSLLQKACKVYQDPDAVNEMVQDIQDLADMVLDNFDSHKEEENEFTDSVKDLVETETFLPTSNEDDSNVIYIEPELPSPDDDITPLTESHATKLIEHLDKTQLKKLAILNDFGNSSALKTIAKKIAETAMTRHRLEQTLQVINPQTILPLAS